MVKKGILFLVIAFILSVGLLTGCQKEPLPAEAEKVFTLEKEETEAATAGIQAESISYVLYLKVADTAFLMDDLQAVPESDIKIAKENLPLYALQKLLAFKTMKNLINPIPVGTQLLKFELVNGLATVNLSKEFVPSSMKKDDAQLAVASIVNTLTFFSEIDSVDLSVEGVKLNSYFGLDVSDTLLFFEGLYPEK
jgi:spore germination protein GerM